MTAQQPKSAPRCQQDVRIALSEQDDDEPLVVPPGGCGCVRVRGSQPLVLRPLENVEGGAGEQPRPRPPRPRGSRASEERHVIDCVPAWTAPLLASHWGAPAEYYMLHSGEAAGDVFLLRMINTEPGKEALLTRESRLEQPPEGKEVEEEAFAFLTDQGWRDRLCKRDADGEWWWHLRGRRHAGPGTPPRRGTPSRSS